MTYRFGSWSLMTFGTLVSIKCEITKKETWTQIEMDGIHRFLEPVLGQPRYRSYNDNLISDEYCMKVFSSSIRPRNLETIVSLPLRKSVLIRSVKLFVLEN